MVGKARGQIGELGTSWDGNDDIFVMKFDNVGSKQWNLVPLKLPLKPSMFLSFLFRKSSLSSFNSGILYQLPFIK